jgi:purine-binding chemotaxis protein CheW
MNTQLAAAAPQTSAADKPAERTAHDQLYLAFMLGSEVFAIDIKRIREIIEYTPPTAVPMMPPALRGVINVRGSVVPVIDLATRFGWEATCAGRRTSIVIVEIQHNQARHVLGLIVDRVNAVSEIAADQIEPAPAFGIDVNTDFIAGIAKNEGRFVIVLDIERTLSVSEIAAIADASEALA